LNLPRKSGAKPLKNRISNWSTKVEQNFEKPQNFETPAKAEQNFEKQMVLYIMENYSTYTLC